MAWDNKCEHCGANLDAGEKCDCQTEEKALTDNEIIKALEYCKEQGITSECEKCNIKEDCRRELIAIALDLINRQQAEIERLKENIDGLNIFSGNYLKLFITAVIKEVLLTLETAIEESNKYIREYDDSKEQRAYNKGLKNAYILVKEMTESVNYGSSKMTEQ